MRITKKARGTKSGSRSKSRSRSKTIQSKKHTVVKSSRQIKPHMDKIVNYLYYNKNQASHFIKHDTRLMSKIGFSRTCFIALCIMLVSYVLSSLEIKEYANLQKLIVELIIGSNLQFGNTILLSDLPPFKLMKGGLERVLKYYLERTGPAEDIIRTINALHYTFKGNFGPHWRHMIIRGTTEHLDNCREDAVNQEGTFFHDFPLNTPIPIAITTQNHPNSNNVWEIDDWGSVFISCVNNRYSIKWYGAYGSDNIQISFGVSEPMTLEHFYSHISPEGNFMDIGGSKFRGFIEQFILRRNDYDKVPQPLPTKDYDTRLIEEIRSWITSSQRGYHFKMIAFMTKYGNVIDEIKKVAIHDGILEASNHIKI